MSVSGKWTVETATLGLPFTIARGTTTKVALPIVELTTDNGTVGYGAAGPSRYYGETADTVGAILPELISAVEEATDPFDLETIRRELAAIAGPNPAARAAVDIALADLAAKRLDVPLARLLGLGTTVTVGSSYTIGIAKPEEMARRAAAAVENGHNILKIKLGGDDDPGALAAVRDVAPDATIRVDANGAWSPGEAVRMIGYCADADVEFVEQPIAASDLDGLLHVYDQSSIPIAADESCVVATDVPRVADRCDIVNVKLMKCGGITEALRVIYTAQAHNREVMLGCMVESAASIAAAAQLVPLVEYVDLDGAMILGDSDPFTNSPVRPGEIEIDPNRPGIGVTPR